MHTTTLQRGVALGLALTTTTMTAACSGEAAAGGAHPSAPPTSAVSPGRPWLLYQGAGDGRLEVRMIRTNRTGDHAVAADAAGGDQTNPDWSPDGQQVTFVMTDDAGTDDLWTVDADGTDPRLLLDCRAPCLYLDDPAWSPDGREIAFSRTDADGGDGVSTLATVDVATGETRIVLGPWRPEFTAGVRWSPDGDDLVFERVHKAGPALEADITGVTLSRVPAVGGPITPLTDPRLFAATADWSPDGRWIVYAALPTPDSPAPDLFALPSSGGEPRRVTRLSGHGGYAAEPTFARAGRVVVFSGRSDATQGEGLLLRVPLTGGPVRPATGADPATGRHPRVRPTPDA